MIKNLFYNHIKFFPDFSTIKITAEPGAVLYSDNLLSGFYGDKHVISQSLDLTGNAVAFTTKRENGYQKAKKVIMVGAIVANIKTAEYEDSDGIKHTDYSGMAVFDLDDPHVKWGGKTHLIHLYQAFRSLFHTREVA